MEKRFLKLAGSQNARETITVAECDECGAQIEKKYAGKQCTAYYFQELPNGTKKNLQCPGYYILVQIPSDGD